MTILWSPEGRPSELRRFAERQGFDDYAALQRWSVTDLDGFWRAVADFYALPLPGPVLATREMPGARWFPEATLNYAAHMLPESDAVAIVQRPLEREYTFNELRRRVAGARAELAGARRRQGRSRGRVPAQPPRDADRVPGVRVAGRDLGVGLARVRPAQRDRPLRAGRAEGPARGRGLRASRQDDRPAHRARRDPRRAADGRARARSGVPGDGDALEFEPSPSTTRSTCSSRSGTTGLPKAIVHGHGGILLEHHKNLGLTWDLRPGARLLQPTTTAWMMWNALVSALLLRASIVLFDGDTAWPSLGPPVGRGRGDRGDDRRRRARVPDGLPQGRGDDPARADRGARHRRLAAPARGL